MQTIGERLEEARKKKGVSIREAAEATKIRGDYIQKFEGNQFDIGLADIYTRGFLRGYATYLHLPGDRLVAELASLGKTDGRPRKPSREIYGRMDLTLTAEQEEAANSGASAAAEAEAAPGTPRPLPTRIGRTGSSLPAMPAVDPATLVRTVKWAVAGLVVLGLFLLASHEFSESAKKAGASQGSYAPGGADASGSPAANGNAPAFGASTVAIVASDDVHVTVTNKADGSQLFQGDLRKGDRQEFPNEALYLSANALENVQIEFKGHLYPTNTSGNHKVSIDCTRLP